MNGLPHALARLLARHIADARGQRAIRFIDDYTYPFALLATSNIVR
jgi:hypothetical protein